MSAISGGGGFHGDNHDQATTTATLPLNPAVATARKTARFGWHDNGECPTRPCQRQQAVATCGDDDFLPPLRTMVRRSGCRRPARHHLVKKNSLDPVPCLVPVRGEAAPAWGCWTAGAPVSSVASISGGTTPQGKPGSRPGGPPSPPRALGQGQATMAP